MVAFVLVMILLVAVYATWQALPSLQALRDDVACPLIADVNRALGELRADGTLKQISEKYFGSDVSAAA